jgi:hypothetical protein
MEELTSEFVKAEILDMVTLIELEQSKEVPDLEECYFLDALIRTKMDTHSELFWAEWDRVYGVDMPDREWQDDEWERLLGVLKYEPTPPENYVFRDSL